MAAASAEGVPSPAAKRVTATAAEGVTAAEVPAGIDGKALLSKLLKQYGFKVAGGQDHLEGKIVRLGHMGYIDFFDVLGALAGFELVLMELGCKLEPGIAVAAAQRAFAKAT